MKTNKEEIVTYEIASQLLRYEPETGKLFWKERGPEWFSDGGNGRNINCQAWNKKWANKEAINFVNPDGYKSGCIFNTKFRAHRVAWLLHYGEWPQYDIDHINGIPHDNRIENLRDVPESINGKNRTRNKNNKSGYSGIYLNNNKFKVEISSERKKIYLGEFDTLSEAILIRKEAENKYSFSKRHGEDRPNG